MRKNAMSESNLPYSFTYKIRQAFWDKKCPICKIKMFPYYSHSKPTIQHNQPVSLGGKHSIENISIICHSCNCSIQDNETSELNNKQVKIMWSRIIKGYNPLKKYYVRKKNV